MSDQGFTPSIDPFATSPIEATVDEAILEEAAEEIAEEAVAEAVLEELVIEEAVEEVLAEADELVLAEELEEEEEEDPVVAFREQMRIAAGDWYVIHSYAGYENKVKGNIETRITTMNMEDYIFQVEVPMEEVTEIKSGVRKLVRRNKFPGYVLVRMELTDESWGAIRHTPGVTGFVGNAHNPTPLRFEEAFNMLKSLVQVTETAPVKGAAGKGASAPARSVITEVDFEIGETITIKEGSFAGLPGSISEIKPESGKLTVLVSLFERETPVELSFDQVTKQ